MAEAYLAKSDCRVIGTTCDGTSLSEVALRAVLKGPNSELHLVKIHSSSTAEALILSR